MEQGEQPGAQPDSRSVEDRVADMMGFKGEEPKAQQREPIEDQAGDDAVGTDDQAAESTESAGAEQSPEGELAEVEFDGKQYRVPAKMREALLRNDDYTQKTQQVAARGQMVEAYETQLQQQAAFMEAAAPVQQRIAQLQQELASFKSLDWSSMDTNQIMQYRNAKDMKADELAEAQQMLGQHQQQFQQRVTEVQSKMLENGVNYLRSAILGWNAERAKAVVAQATREGLDQHQISILDRMSHPLAPMMIKLLDKAARLEAIESRVGDARAKARAAPPVIKPGASNPEMSEKMRNLNMRKQIKNAPNQSAKNALIQQRIERMF